MNTSDSTIIIPLTKGQQTIIDAVDSDLADLKWFAAKQKISFYARRSVYVSGGASSYLLLHRVILERKIGRPLQKEEHCDHINGNKLDNRRDNLRISTPGQNIINVGKRKNNTSGYKGVSWRKDMNLWHAQIQVNRIALHLGFYKTPEEAHEAYKKAAGAYFGEFARFE